MNPQYFIGLMSGTSADSIDAALVSIGDHTELLATYAAPLSEDTKTAILSLCESGPDEIERAGLLDRHLGKQFAHSVNTLLKQTNMDTTQITAIGSHGQTIRHIPPTGKNTAFTCQIGDPNTIAELTGITTIADFRRRDVAAGGHGAPLAPGMHQALFSCPHENRVIVNIGGMSNVTLLRPNEKTLGFDTGPGNALMDGWIKRHLNVEYDAGGQWAASGHVVEDLLNRLKSHAFLSQSAPKSTGREAFNLTWLDDELTKLGAHLSPVDIQATLLELTALSIVEAITSLIPTTNLAIYICGGGARNHYLMDRIAFRAAPARVSTTAEIGIAPEWVEAVAFAWLACETMNHRPGNVASVTGANGPRILGGIYYA